jgi:hypothetical protein
MRMTNRNSQGVRRVVRSGSGVEAEQELHHVLDLPLLRAAVADDGKLDLGGGILDDRESGLDGREDRDASGVAESQGAPNILCVKEVFHGDASGRRIAQQGG